MIMERIGSADDCCLMYVNLIAVFFEIRGLCDDVRIIIFHLSRLYLNRGLCITRKNCSTIINIESQNLFGINFMRRKF